MADKKKTNENLNLEESFEKLSGIVDDMEKPDISLEEAFSRYKEGLALVRSCNEMIDAVEKEVKKISDSGEITEFE